MTAVPESAQCGVHRDLGRRIDADLPVQDLFPAGVMRAIDLNDELRPGADAADDKCEHALPDADDAWCAQPVPWASLDWEDLVNATGASRIRRVGLSFDKGRTTATPGYRAGRSVWYVEIELAGKDRKGLTGFLRSAFQRCAEGTVSIVHGVSGVVGTVESASPTGQSPAVAFLTPTRAAWVILDGGAWTAPEREHALAAIAAHLRDA